VALKIDDNLLQEIGLGSLPDPDKARMRQHIYETLEMRVGMRLADQMSNEQLDEFEQFVNNQDDAGAFKWLETNFPNYKDVVNEEFEKLKQEVQQLAPQILSSALQAAAAQPPTMGPAPDPIMAPPAPQPAAPAYGQPPLQPQVPPMGPPQPNFGVPPQQPQQPMPGYGQPGMPMPPQPPQPTNPIPPQPPYGQPGFPDQQPPAGPGMQPPQAA
jgi:hypothetical protein